MIAGEKPRRSRRGAGARQSGGEAAAAAKAHYRHLRNPFKPSDLLSEDHVDAIHQASLTVLREIGIRVLHDEARAVYAAAGALVDDETLMVRMDADMVLAAVAMAPEAFDLVPRRGTPYRIGGDHTVFAMVAGAPNASDMDRGRRSGTLETFEDFLRLAQSYEVIHMVTPTPEPIDVALHLRGLQMMLSQLTLTDKFPLVYSRGRGQVEDAFDMVAIANGVDRQALADRVHCFTIVNANSPLQLDVPMCQGILDFARNGQLMVLTPFTLAGAMAPVSLAGALTQQNAEALAGLALAQFVKPGAPVAYGGFTSNVDMKSGAPAFGTPEYVKATLATGQLARRYRLPWRSSNTNASNAPDAQSAYESQMSIWASLLGGCNLLMHGAGWLEGGLTASYEKFIIDIEMLQMMAEVFQPLKVDAAELALDAMREVGPGGHYFGAAHTLERYETAFYSPLVSDWRNFENWRDAGAPNADLRANRIWKKTLEDHTPPPMEADRGAALEAFFERRSREGGAEPAN